MEKLPRMIVRMLLQKSSPASVGSVKLKMYDGARIVLALYKHWSAKGKSGTKKQKPHQTNNRKPKKKSETKKNEASNTGQEDEATSDTEPRPWCGGAEEEAMDDGDAFY